jgi:hypothetical protein
MSPIYFYAQEKEKGNTENITSNPNPDYRNAFYSEIFELMEDYAITFSKWLIVNCTYQNHCVWVYKGDEYTQSELMRIFKREHSETV